MFKIADNALKTRSGAHICQAVATHFKSMHYVSSKLVAQSIAINLALNKKITPKSANEAITCLRRRTRSLYTTIESAFFAVSDSFELYAANILGDEYEKVRALNMRTANYIVYVISLELERGGMVSQTELIKNAMSYDELISYGFI